jgi:hypothetical protein
MMLFARWRSVVMFGGLLAGVVLLSGCGGDSNQPTGKTSKVKPAHGEWWCQEHGIPEHICSQCNAEYAARCKKEGDWCKEHDDRAESQCFKCDPSRYKQFEDMYVAKYGKKPEPPPKEEFEK